MSSAAVRTPSERSTGPSVVIGTIAHVPDSGSSRSRTLDFWSVVPNLMTGSVARAPMTAGNDRLALPVAQSGSRRP